MGPPKNSNYLGGTPVRMPEVVVKVDGADRPNFSRV